MAGRSHDGLRGGSHDGSHMAGRLARHHAVGAVESLMMVVAAAAAARASPRLTRQFASVSFPAEEGSSALSCCRPSGWSEPTSFRS